MKAIALYRYLSIEDPESLIDIEIDKPIPVGKDLLVKVKAISVNPVDVKIRAPKNQVEETPRILGWDVAGIVDQVGPECTLFKPGDEVFYAGCITRPGGNSEFHVVDERIVGKKPHSLDFAEAAALPLTTITAWEALFDRLGINLDPSKNENKSILVIGAAGGVGSMAIQFAALAGLTVIGTASREESFNWAKTHGAHFIINHNKDFAPQLKDIEMEEVNYILNLSDTDSYMNDMIEHISPQGKICSIVENKEPLNIPFNKSITFVWEMVFSRSLYQTSDMIEQHNLLNRVAEFIDAGKIKTTLTERVEPINATTLRYAHSKVETGRMIGKIVLENF